MIGKSWRSQVCFGEVWILSRFRRAGCGRVSHVAVWYVPARFGVATWRGMSCRVQASRGAVRRCGAWRFIKAGRDCARSVAAGLVGAG